MKRAETWRDAYHGVLVLMAAILATACIGWGQLTTTGTISGIVTDSTGALVPDAKVTLQNQDTKISTTTQTSADGTRGGSGIVWGPHGT